MRSQLNDIFFVQVCDTAGSVQGDRKMTKQEFTPEDRVRIKDLYEMMQYGVKNALRDPTLRGSASKEELEKMAAMSLEDASPILEEMYDVLKRHSGPYCSEVVVRLANELALVSHQLNEERKLVERLREANDSNEALIARLQCKNK